MTLARCLVPDLATYTRDGFGLRFGLGAVADLDAEVGTSGMTLRAALAEHVDKFELIDPPAAPDGLPIEEQE